MKTIIIAIALAIPAISIAQTPAKKPPVKPATTAAKPPAQKALSKADANAMVEFSNKLTSFLRTHLSVSKYAYGITGIASPMDDDHISISDRFVSDWLTYAEQVADYKERNDNADPTAIPKCIAPADAAKIKAELKNYQTSLQTLLNLKTTVYSIMEANNDVVFAKKNKETVAQLKSLVEKMHTPLDSLGNAVSNLYELADDIGGKAEEVILAGHAYKKEILDMKYVLKRARKIMNIIYDAESAEGMTPLLPETDKLMEEIKTMTTSYEKYSIKAKDNSTDRLKECTFYFYKECKEKFMPSYEKFKKEYTEKTYAHYTWEKRAENFEFDYSQLLDKYNTFVAINNR